MGKEEEAKPTAIPTFEALARQYIAESQHSWRNAKHRAQWLSTLQAYAFPSLGSLRVNEATRKEVAGLLSPIWAPDQRVIPQRHRSPLTVARL